MDSIDFSDSKSTWKQLKKLFNLGKGKKSEKIDPENIGKFYSHFKQLNERRTSDPSPTENENCRDFSASVICPLDSEITEQEILKAIDGLKRGKAQGADNIHNDFLKCTKDTLKRHLHILFNKILSSGEYPTVWSYGVIIPIHKKGPTSDPGNYRGITLLSALGKVFNSIMNCRLYNFLVEREILKPEQCGFRKKQGTSDGIFVLKSLVSRQICQI